MPLATLTPEPILAAPEAASSTPASYIPPTTKAVPLDAGITEAFPLLQSDTINTLAALTPLQYGNLAALGLARWSPAGLATLDTQADQHLCGSTLVPDHHRGHITLVPAAAPLLYQTAAQFGSTCALPAAAGQAQSGAQQGIQDQG